MFENMMKYEKVWKLFCKWLKKNEMIDDIRQFNINCKKIGKTNSKKILFVLSMMPFFFDEYGINIYTPPFKGNEKTETIFVYVILTELDSDSEGDFKTRQEALIKACEKAFEILEDQNG